MAQSLAVQPGRSQTATESGKIRFIQLLRDSSLEQATKIVSSTKDSWQIGQLSFSRYPSVRSDAMLSELISPQILKANILTDEFSVTISGLRNPILFHPENLDILVSVIDWAIHHEDYRVRLALISNPGATRETLSKIFAKETHILGKKDQDVINKILEHPNTPMEIKAMYANSTSYGTAEYLFKANARRGIERHNNALD